MVERYLGDLKLIRVFAKHEPYTDGHLGKVMAEMCERGAPTIRVVRFRGDLYALEGSHRLRCAHDLNLVPEFVEELPDRFDPTDEQFWEQVSDKLPHYAWLRAA